MKKYWKEFLLWTIMVVFIIPLGLAFLLRFDFIITVVSSDWIGFWGSYLGGIIGGMVTLFVLFKTLQDNRELQRKEQRISFCNEICRLSGELCGEVNRECMYILKYMDKENCGSKDDLFNALMAKNKTTELLHVCSAQLISKVNDEGYIGAGKLMDQFELLSQLENKVSIKFEYIAEKEGQLKKACDNVLPVLGEMRDWIVEFLESNA